MEGSSLEIVHHGDSAIHARGAVSTPIASVRGSRSASPHLSLRSLFSGGVALVVGTAAGNILSLVFSLMSARLIAPANYATLTACLSLLVVAAVPAAALQLATASYTADPHLSSAQSSGVRRTLLRGGVMFGAGLGVLALLGSAPLGSFLHLPSLIPLWLTAVILGASFIGPVYQGSLQGAHRFAALALVMSSAFAIRVVAAALLLVLGTGEVGALTGVLLGTVGSALLGGILCRSTETVHSDETLPLRELARTLFPTFIMQLSLTSMLFIDTLLSKHFFTPATVGAYAGLATTARILAYLPGALSVLLFP
ncbi:MAG: oligosaccharide flippase family protein, partial [Chloroflexi bacterium]|nr:oligosaccharide flippase family protein [Chloroflexota bacterium]